VESLAESALHSTGNYVHAALQSSATLAMASIPAMPRMQSLSNAISKTALKLKGVLMHMYMRSGSIYLKAAHLTAPEDWLAVIQQNLNSAFYALRAIVPGMVKQGGGSLLFFSSVAAQAGLANHEAIAAAKGGLEAMVRSAAATYAPRGIRINAIAPSLTDTPLSKAITGSPQALAFTQKMHPLGAINTADAVANMAAWLLSDAASQVTGQIFVIDGGLSSIVPKPKA
jgi:NAD(P)-dependent dehydrogenase (short-subunit alcohol dehydrogenase family)